MRRVQPIRPLAGVLAMLLGTPVAFAQHTMHGMTMPADAGTVASPASPATVEGAAGAPQSPATGHPMPGMTHPATPTETVDHPVAGARQARRQPPPHGSRDGIEVLDAGQQVGRRPRVSGLDLHAPGQMMQGMPPMQGGSAPPDARSPDYSDGITDPRRVAGMAMLEKSSRAMLLVDRLEYVHGRDGGALAASAQGWYGNDHDKLWLKAEGEHAAGRLQELRTEALWDHAVATYWDLQLGVRHDARGGPARDWVAFGVQGLAPYWFDLEATGYVGSAGRTALRIEAEYELRLTQRLVLQPDIGANLYGRDDPQRHLGSGLSEIAAGLRLRFAVTRQFTPYMGVVWARRFGGTADQVRAHGEPAFDRQWVAGVRFWF
jgi:copper resistance protein B